MSHTINSCIVYSHAIPAHPNGDMTTRGIVDFISNKGYSKYDPVKIKDVKITNPNGVVFGEFRQEISVDTLRAIANGIKQICDDAETAMARMTELNK
jgi:hypothetical protein